MKFEKKIDAVHAWVNEFNAHPTEMIRTLIQADPSAWEEVTEINEDKYYSGELPAWGTMWNFGSSFDENWIEKEKNLKTMSECGFRIYHHHEWGYFFGIDGGGYDFYEAHWVPLYDARGLQWHKAE